MTHRRTALWASVSLFAILAANPSSLNAQSRRTANVPIVAPTPTVSPWTVWLEGGGVNSSGGDPYVNGFASPGFFVNPKRWGWEAAGGVDYRFNSIWHVSGQFRYGTNRAASKAHNPNATFLVPTTSATSTPLGVTGSNSASRKEEHWLADFMVGRDMNIGMGSSQVKFGIRVASIKGTTTGSAAWNVPTTTATTTTAVHRRSYAQSSTFVGVGPRLAIEGSVPLGGGWSFDYNGGIAALVGDRKLSQHVTLSGANVNPCLAGCPVTGTSVSNGTVFNLDVQPALAYAIDRTWKASVSYRFDGYWNAMRTYDANSNQVNVDRFYQGAFLRLTATR